MRHIRNIKIIAIIAFSISLLGFIIDLNELDPSRINNLLDITMMTFIVFGIGMFLYGLIVLSIKIIPRIKL